MNKVIIELTQRELASVSGDDRLRTATQFGSFSYRPERTSIEYLAMMSPIIIAGAAIAWNYLDALPIIVL